MTATIRLALETDADQVLEIYRPFCTGTPISFETTAPTLAETRDRIVETLKFFPWLVAERAGQTVGYVYAGRHRERAAYRWSVDVTAYIRAELQRSFRRAEHDHRLAPRRTGSLANRREEGRDCEGETRSGVAHLMRQVNGIAHRIGAAHDSAGGHGPKRRNRPFRQVGGEHEQGIARFESICRQARREAADRVVQFAIGISTAA